MCVGIIKDEMICLIDPLFHETAMTACRTMGFTKLPMKGSVIIEDLGMKTKKEFDFWIKLCSDVNTKTKSSKRKLIV